MTDDETSNLFGLDDSSLGFIDDGSASGDIKTDPSNTSDDVQFDSSGWEFPDTVPFSFDTISSAPAVAPSYSTSVWDSPPFDFQPSPSLGFDDFSPSNNDATFLFGGPIVPSQTQNRPRAPAMKQTRQPTTTLTPAAQEKLRQIAMPAHLQYHSPKSASSPDSATDGTKAGSRSPSDKDKKPNSKKRKVSEDDDDDDDDDEDKPVKKTSHNMIEKRYRNNLNDKIAALRDSVPSLRIMSKSAKGEDTTEDRQELHGLTPAHKLNKATVLSKATEYIRHLEKRFNRVQEENDTMRQRIAAFEKLFMAGAMNGSIAPTQQPPTPMQFPGQNGHRQQQSQHDFMGSPTGSPNENSTSLGMIQVPDDMKRILAASSAAGQAYPLPNQSFRGSPPQIIQQQQLQQQQQEQAGGWGNAAPYFGKLMVGSLAGLMIMEAVRQEEVSNESPEGRGLFALPVHLLGRFATSLDFHLMGYHAHTSLKLILLLGTVLWVFIPSLFASQDENPKKPQISTLRPAPSLASSIHVRRQAWLTAVQSVWIPRHNLLLEASALILKAAKLSVLNVVGFHGYKLLSGTTQAQETARTRAWAIALDSQLVGGDVEINKSRLLITLLASGTLPDTPARLMLKALHIRVLTWDLSQHKWRLGASNAIAASLARSKWNDARHLNQLLVQSRGTTPQHDDELPDHLAQLLEQSCDDVLNPELIQRAHNLAFNKDTRYAIENPIDGMDCVVEDSAIGSPMDAVSAWYSTQVLHEALTSTLDKTDDSPTARDDKMELAVHTAPVGSVAQARAIVARAALSEQHRGSNIALAFSTVGTDKPDSPVHSSVSLVGTGSSASSHDVRLTLRCAQVMAHLGRTEVRNGNLKDIAAIDSITIPKDVSDISLLGFTAVMELVESVLEHKAAAEAFSSSIERLAGSLRLWIGGNAGDNCGLNPSTRHKVVDRCLGITKSLVGMEVDTGYGSLSEDESCAS